MGKNWSACGKAHVPAALAFPCESPGPTPDSDPEGK